MRWVGRGEGLIAVDGSSIQFRSQTPLGKPWKAPMFLIQSCCSDSPGEGSHAGAPGAMQECREGRWVLLLGRLGPAHLVPRSLARSASHTLVH